MPVREHFPKFEDIENSRPEELGAEIVLDLQKRPRNEFFFPTNFPSDLARHYQREQPSREFIIAVYEAIDWARHELLLVRHHNSTPPSDALTLSRRGLSFTRDHIERLRLERIRPELVALRHVQRSLLKKILSSWKTDHEKAQYAWDYLWCRVIDRGALLTSMVARKECGTIP